MLKALFPGAWHLQNVHPLTIHFPIGLLATAVFLYLLAYPLRKEQAAVAGFACLALGTLAALVSVGTGLYAEPGVMIARSVRTRLLHEHKELMLTATSLAVVSAVWAVISPPLPSKGRPLFILLLFVMLAVMALGSDYGARMVFDYNAGGNACPQPIEFSD